MPRKPVATRETVRAVADALARARGSPDLVTMADLRKRLADRDGSLDRFLAEWRRDTAGEPPPAIMAAVAAAVRAAWRRQPGAVAAGAAGRPGVSAPAKPAASRRGRPPKNAGAAARRERGSFLATAAAEEEEGRRKPRRNARPEDAARKLPQRKTRGERNGPDGGSAIARLRDALEGRGPPLAPPRTKVKRSDWDGAVNRDFARAVATRLRDLGHPLQTEQIHAFLSQRFGWVAIHPDRMVRMVLAGSRIACRGGLCWFDYEKMPSRNETRTAERRSAIEPLYLAAAMEVLRNAPRLMTAAELEAALGEARAHVRPGWLGDRLRRMAARPDGDVVKAGESYRWVEPKPPALGGRR
jgi:hypothetical protein